MRKYLPKFTGGGDISASDRNNVRAKRMGTYAAEKRKQEAAAAAIGGEPVEYTREMYKEDKAVNKTVRESEKEGSSKGLSESASAGISAGAKVGGAVLDSVTAGMDVDENSSFKAEQAVGDALMASGNPYAMAAGVAVKGMSALSQATGTNANTISKSEANAAGISGAGRVANNVLGFMSNIGLLGPGAGALIGKTDSVKMSEQTKSMSNAFAGSVNDISTAEGMSGGRYFIGRDKINSLINEADRQNRLITNISVTNTQRKASDYGLDLAQQNLNRYAGNNYQNMHIGRHGMKLMSIEECRRILEARKEEVQSFHNGGVIGIDVNVIPEGKYHAHKNHLGELSDEFDDLTKKGIPVVAHSEGGEIEQVAEIEKMELIFRLEVTEKLEELFKDGSDEAMIEAGKLVAYEIMENTQDNSGEVLKDE